MFGPALTKKYNSPWFDHALPLQDRPRGLDGFVGVGSVSQFGLLRNVDASLHCGTIRNRLQPALQMIEPIHRNTGPGINLDPTPIGDIGNGIIARQIFVVAQPSIQYFKELRDLF